MSKKNIAVSAAIGLASLGLATSVFAHNDAYASAPVPVATQSPYASSADAGFVVGLEGGYADTHWNNFDAVINLLEPKINLKTKSNGFAGRAFLGYDFNQYFAAETGYVYLPKTTSDQADGSEIKNYAFDLLGKISVPVTTGLKLYAKAGLGYFSSTFTGLGPDETNRHVGPAFGVGAGYEVVPNLTVNLSWMRYSGNGKIQDNYQPNPDVVLLGLSYKFPTR
jgi:opacity protein-like surface antigen